MKLLTDDVRDILIFFFVGNSGKCKKSSLEQCDHKLNSSKLRQNVLECANQVTGDGYESFYIFIASLRFLAQFMNILPCINSQ